MSRFGSINGWRRTRRDRSILSVTCSPGSGVSIDPATGFMPIATLEGVMQAKPGDYIIRGVQGEFYPCKPDIFEATSERVEG